ncbi:MAG: hypothetical protein PHG14_11175 [Desulfobacter postgatei]|uniref:hypothetical protein n=1 Tax=Desulfobacter postgatei TaxID=2293 RepID=UPI0023F335DD|nr:hypothetical protein [Desulfobacter postgatei]MDD4274275.1 hypothetical protein [Desulfobacter postgatei]
MQSYNELQAFLQDVQQRKMDLNDQKNALIGQREKLRGTWEDAVFNGEGETEAKQDMLDLESKIDDLNDHIRILESRTRTSSKVIELAQAVWDDCHHTCQGVRNNYIAQAEKTLKAKEIYLRELRILGEIARVGEKYSFYASQASQYLSEHVHVGIGIDEFKECAISENEIKTTYKNGNK